MYNGSCYFCVIERQSNNELLATPYAENPLATFQFETWKFGK